MWQIFHKLGSPKWFFGIATRLKPWLLVSALALLTAGLVWGLAFAPKDYLQGNSYRIIFIHVPSAFLAQSVYIMMAVAAVVTLVWRMKLADVFVKAVAPVGLILTFLALFTGAVWGKPTWGTWWIWDARLTSMLILLFLYGGAIALGHPLGATGAMIMGTMVDELERSGKETALVTLCIGAGMGTATIIERV